MIKLRDKEARKEIEELKKQIDNVKEDIYEYRLGNNLLYGFFKKVTVKESLEELKKKFNLLLNYLNLEEKKETERTILVKKTKKGGEVK